MHLHFSYIDIYFILRYMIVDVMLHKVYLLYFCKMIQSLICDLTMMLISMPVLPCLLKQIHLDSGLFIQIVSGWFFYLI